MVPNRANTKTVYSEYMEKKGPAAMPPNARCDMPSPMRDCRRRTINTPSTEHNTAAHIPPTRARWKKLWLNIQVTSLKFSRAHTPP